MNPVPAALSPNRRKMLATMVAAITTAALPPIALAQSVEPVFAPGLRRFLDAFTDTIIPPTETPGAVSAGVPAYLLKLVGRTGALDTFVAACAAISTYLDNAGGGDFTRSSAAIREDLLARLDAQAMTGRHDSRPGNGAASDPDHETYLLLKSLVAWTYFTSQAGGSEHLRFEQVFGPYVPDVPLAADWVNYTNETILGQ
jgi:hypothetical protein